MIALYEGDLFVGIDAATAIDGASAVGQLHFVVCSRRIFFLAVVIVVVERDVRVVALNQASARRVVLGGRQRQAGVFRQRIHGLHQTLAKCVFADDQPAIVVLNRARNNLGRRCRATIDQHHQRIFLAAIAVARNIALLG